AALSRLVFAGSVNSKNLKSSFSNTPGTTGFINTANQKTALSSLWLMAPGESLIGAYYSGANNYAYASGTSFSAPMISGALALLGARWPVLFRNGTATRLLFQTASDLGTKGVDTTFGTGLLNMNKAWQPAGALTITNTKGQKIAVSSITGSMLSSGAFGSLSSLTSKLSSMTALDSYQRDFKVNLSSLITPSKASSATASAATAPKTTATGARFTDGSSFAMASMQYRDMHDVKPFGMPEKPNGWYMSFTDSRGSTFAGGYGFPASAAFTEAMWGSDNLAAQDVTELGISNSLMRFAEGGQFTAYGRRVGGNSRLAFSWSQTSNTVSMMDLPWTVSNASAFGAGFTTKVTDRWSVGLTVNALNEKNGLLGSTYADSGIGFGKSHNSVSTGITSTFDMGNKLNLVVDASWVRSDGASMSDGLISNVSSINARSMGAALVQRDAFRKDDRLSLAVRKPLRIYSGSASLSMTSVDSQGYAYTQSESVSLKPDGNETDFSMTYETPSKYGIDWTASLTARHDADNVRGRVSADLLVGAKLSF
ncbi:MAG: S8 family serine peptidase, partial [Alphaproteobacteria bacterium]|nr:S8 family serine peptidase [Alphaproteobacteria bacterium]